ncbi:DUF1800 domain-containing protein [Sphingorhabdus sp. Alg239-R122]|uniref:DUF1800 domain-containing protein n=1 Tax=Sphingorhabdus sp. Alg239-R122 TaxID=2305989 RepID=UPI0013D97953|nr:DUF1800 domain-containing protein [Sphingorhabdus sp. Alg239-R122]
MRNSEIAENRFGYGARSKVVRHDNPQRFLLAQMESFDARPTALRAMPTLESISIATRAHMAELRKSGTIKTGNGKNAAFIRDKKFANAVRSHMRKSGRDHYDQSVMSRFALATKSDASFMERIVHFWSNHFAVSAEKSLVIGFAGSMEFEAIRPHILGKFSDLLKSVERHPAMLIYLDQVQSVGPGSPLAMRTNAVARRKLGLNENLAREILELHTLGVNGGYSQVDVTEFARALTGRTVGALPRGTIARMMDINDRPGLTQYHAALHEPGTRRIMGHSYRDTGERLADRILGDLALHPSTAKFISTKLARHFAGDDAPETLVKRLTETYLKTDGDLPSLYHVLVQAPEAWRPEPVKYKQPWEWLVSVYRGTQASLPVKNRQIGNIVRTLGQPVWRPGSPAGYGDRSSDWIGPDALFKRAEMANFLTVKLSRTVDAVELAPALFPSGLSLKTSAALGSADNRRQALAMLLASPEYLQR